jgi:rhamnosyltransferase
VFLDKAVFPEIKSDLALARPDVCLDHMVPLLKIKSFLYFPYSKHIIKILEKDTSYPIPLIFDHLNQIYEPDITLFTQSKIISVNKTEGSNNSDQIRLAIHLHVFYIDILDKYMLFFNNINNTKANFDLYITTDSHNKKDAIYNSIKKQACFSKLKEIIITENQERDFLPWLFIKDRLNQYDIVGHFYTKKYLNTEEWIDITKLDDILDLLLYNINNIINEFHNTNNLGILIPELPYIFRKFALPDGFSENMNKIWERLKCHKQIDFGTIKNIVFPIGTMFWYRPAALKPLLELQLLPDDIPRETIFHSIERLLVYIAWNEGYDYRISLPQVRDSNFIDIIYRLYDTITDLTNSHAYRVGRIILTVPKAIKSLLKK